MEKSKFSHEHIIQVGQFSPEDIREINQRRRDHNRLGFAYQLAFVRLANRFPAQQPMELLPELLTYVGVQLGINGRYPIEQDPSVPRYLLTVRGKGYMLNGK